MRREFPAVSFVKDEEKNVRGIRIQFADAGAASSGDILWNINPTMSEPETKAVITSENLRAFKGIPKDIWQKASVIHCVAYR